MDQAIFEPVTGTIVGVRGQWLLQFSATTGAFIQGMRFMTGVGGISSITTLNGKLYIAVSYVQGMQVFATYPAPTVDLDVFIVDPATFSTTGRFNWGGLVSYGGGTGTEVRFLAGFRRIAASGSRIYAFNGNDGIDSADPTNVPGTRQRVSFSYVDDFVYDATNNLLWVASSFDQDVVVFDPDFSSFNQSHSVGSNNDLFGITYNTDHNSVYVATGGETIYKINAADAAGFANFPISTLHTGHITCGAVRIKSVNSQAGNPHNGKILIPTFDGDEVLIFDPASDTVESVQTGFVGPIDIIVCPTANFALQTGPVPLKQIT